MDFYSNSCPKAEKIVLDFVSFDFIDRVKTLLEAECPGIVSCADVLALVARDSIVATFQLVEETALSQGPRRHYLISLVQLATSLLSEHFSLTKDYVKDLVLLSGDQDPSLDSEYAANLKANKCKTPNDTTTNVEMDPGSFRTFDLSYYSLLLKRRGLFESNAALITNSTSKSFITQLLQGSLLNFFLEFASSMEKMGQIDVKTGSSGSALADLKMDFYSNSCPKAEKIVLDFVNKHIPNAPSLAATIIRMHFHDCFVRGCDGSVLVNSTSSNHAEKDGAPNLSLRGFDFIDRVKTLLEAECPGIVSCADVLALVARDSIVATGGPFWKVPTGRRDGVISRSSEALSNIPGPTSNFTTLRTLFANKGLNVKDLVLLSGDQDPSLDSEYAANLKANKCKTPNDTTTNVEMDPGSFRTFDLSYYSLLLKRRGLFESDAALITNSTSKSFITQLLQGSLKNFFLEFASSMEKMGQIDVKTGSSGEIRKQCAIVNS
ncbi:hypothetical protein HHK36_005584 [Tetracentron sinense]|uniref:peroxidase n=1 Tax=Tetracentron sinense TaxID=13715 RepID=A0A834ZQM3_TETSI|nr:hypothetical protein HHK36_005584 [Tetracentron sinense]